MASKPFPPKKPAPATPFNKGKAPPFKAPATPSKTPTRPY